MRREEVVNLAVALLVPIVTAVLGVVGIVFGDWRLRRTQAGRRKLSLEDAGRQVSFAAEWWNARKLLADSPEAEQEATKRATAWLEEASALVAESKPPLVEEKMSTVRRALLAHPLKGWAANVVRGAFYLCLGLMLIWAGAFTDDALDRKHLGEVLVSDIVIASILAVLALSLRVLVGLVERSRPDGQKRGRRTLRRALLLYRFDRRAARVIRIIFYIYALCSVVFSLSLLWDGVHYPRYLPGDIIQVVAFIGWAVALRYWAASLELAGKGNEASRVAASATAVDVNSVGLSG